MSQAAKLSALFPHLLPDVELKDVDGLIVMLDRQFIKPGQVLLREGEISPGLFLVEQGVLAVQLSDGELVATLGPGAIIGDVSLMDGGPVSATVVAKTAVVLDMLPLSRFRALKDERPSIAVALRRGLCRSLSARIRDASDKVERLDPGSDAPTRPGLLDALRSMFHLGAQT